MKKIIASIFLASLIAVAAFLPVQAEWQTIKSENFEGSFPNTWSVYDANGTTNGEYYWGVDEYRKNSGTYGAYCIRAGTDGKNPPATYNYGVRSVMQYGPFNLSDCTSAQMTFYRWFWTNSGDYLWFEATGDLVSWVSQVRSGYATSWALDGIDFSSLCGDTTVWVRFSFETSSQAREGVWLDDIIIEKDVPSPYNLTVTPDPASVNDGTTVRLTATDSVDGNVTQNTNTAWSVTAGSCTVNNTAPNKGLVTAPEACAGYACTIQAIYNPGASRQDTATINVTDNEAGTWNQLTATICSPVNDGANINCSTPRRRSSADSCDRGAASCTWACTAGCSSGIVTTEACANATYTGRCTDGAYNVSDGSTTTDNESGTWNQLTGLTCAPVNDGSSMLTACTGARRHSSADNCDRGAAVCTMTCTAGCTGTNVTEVCANGTFTGRCTDGAYNVSDGGTAVDNETGTWNQLTGMTCAPVNDGSSMLAACTGARRRSLADNCDRGAAACSMTCTAGCTGVNVNEACANGTYTGRCTDTGVTLDDGGTATDNETGTWDSLGAVACSPANDAVSVSASCSTPNRISSADGCNRGAASCAWSCTGDCGELCMPTAGGNYTGRCTDSAVFSEDGSTVTNDDTIVTSLITGLPASAPDGAAVPFQVTRTWSDACLEDLTAGSACAGGCSGENGLCTISAPCGAAPVDCVVTDADASNSPQTVTATSGDADLDSYGAGCLNGPDCNDGDSAVNPGETEVLCDAVDQDCDGLGDDDRDQDLDTLWYCAEQGYGTQDTDPDSDDDGLGDYLEAVTVVCLDPINDDTDSDLLLDGVEDGDTDGVVDPGETDPCNPDSDGDALDDGADAGGCLSALDWDSDNDYIPDGFEQANLGSSPPLDPCAAGDSPMNFDGDSIPNGHEYWNGSNLWSDSPHPIPGYQIGCYYWGKADGGPFVQPADIVAMQKAYVGVSVDYSDVLPSQYDPMDLDRDMFPGPGDIVLAQGMYAGLSRPGGYVSSPIALTVEDAPVSPVAVGDTTHITVSVHAAGPGAEEFSPGMGVVFWVTSGNAVLLGGEGSDPGEAAGNRYDVSMKGADGAPANVVVLVTGPGTVIVNAKVPACGTEPLGRWCAEVGLAVPVVVNP